MCCRHASRVQAKSSKLGRPAFPLGSWGEPAQRVMKRSVTFPMRASSLPSAPDPLTPRPPRSNPLPTIHDVFPQDATAVHKATSGFSLDPLLQPSSRQSSRIVASAPKNVAVNDPLDGFTAMQRLASSPRDDAGSWGSMQGLQRIKSGPSRQLPPRDLWEQLGGHSSPAGPLRQSGSSGDPGVIERGLPTARDVQGPGLGRLKSGLSGFDRRAFQDELAQAHAGAEGDSPGRAMSHDGLSARSDGRHFSMDEGHRQQQQQQQQQGDGLDRDSRENASNGRQSNPRQPARSQLSNQLSSLGPHDPRHSPRAPSGLGPSSSMRDERFIDPQPAAHIQLPIRSQDENADGSADENVV